MKRRSFLKGLLGAPAAAAVTTLEPAAAALEPTPWQPTIFEYGKTGILELRFDTVKRQRIDVETYCPENDWINECEDIRESIFGPFTTDGITVVERRKMDFNSDWYVVVIPVNELTRVRVFADDVLIASDYPKPAEGVFQFRPWDFISNIEIGAVRG